MVSTSNIRLGWMSILHETLQVSSMVLPVQTREAITMEFDPKPGQGTVKFVFIGQTGSGDTGDMALDDISFVEDCSQAAARQSYQTVGEFVRILQIFCI